MYINSTYECKSAIVVDEELLRDLDELIREDYEEVKYIAYLENKDEILFDSVDELVNYDNYSNRAIKELRIKSGYDFSVDISPDEWPITGYKSTVRIEFVSKDVDQSELKKIKYNNLFKKHKRSKVYTFISKLSFFKIMVGLWILGACLFIPTYMLSDHKNTKVYSVIDLVLAAVVAVSIVFFFIIVTILKGRFFSPIVFSLGQKIKELKIESKVKWNILWVILIPVVITVLLHYILK